MQTSDKRTHILEAALDLFTELGFHGTSTAAIAKKADVAVGTLFHYFATKEDLINALYLEIKIRMRSRLTAGLDRAGNTEERFGCLWTSSVRWIQEKPREIQFFRLFGASPNISQATREQGMQHFAFIFDVIEQGKKQGMLKDLPTDLLMEFMMSSLSSTQSYFFEHPDHIHDPDVKRRIFEAIWDMIRKK
ncbi:TetR/AcrR family transcriptional regulator [bacterium]|nr:TetR/AcrR family transcriptional regulator [bacterium]